MIDGQVGRLSSPAPVPKGERIPTLIDMLNQIGIAAIVPLHCERSTVKPRQSSGCRIGVVYAGGNIDLDPSPWL